MSDSAFELVFQDNQSFMYTHAPHCTDCSRVTDDGWIDPRFELHRHVFDLSVTSDGCLIASDAFAEVCEGSPGITFKRIRSIDGFWAVEVEPIVSVEPFASRVRSGIACDTCGLPRYASREGPLRVPYPEKFGVGFHRTDLVFGDTADFGRRQPVRLRPTIAVDADTGRHLKSTALRGIHVIPTD